MTRARPAAAPRDGIRITLWLAWSVILIPLVGVGLFAVTPRRGDEGLLIELARLDLGTAIVDAATGTDRRGDRLAVLTIDRAVHVITGQGAGLRHERVALPDLGERPNRGEVSFADLSHDGRLDLCVLYPPSLYDVPGVGHDPRWPCIVLVDRVSGYRLSAVGRQLPVWFGDPSDHGIRLDGEQLTARLVHRPDGGPTVTRLIDSAERVRHVIDGELVRAFDCDGDSNSELVTVAGRQPGTEVVTLSLLRWTGRGYRAAWTLPLERGRGIGRSMPPLVADLDRNAVPELIVCERDRGRVRLFSLRPPDD